MSRYQIALTVLVLSSISVVSIALDGERQENTPFNVSSTDAPKFAVLERTAPTYPKAAIDNKVEGYAVVEFDITTSGTVAKPRVVESKPSQIFDQAAIDAVAHWLYLPEYNNGKAMPTTGVRTRLSFSLKDKPGYDSDTDLIQVISIGNEQGGKPWVYLVGDSITSAQVEAAFNDLKLDKLPASELKQILATIEEQAARTSSGDLYIALARAYESQNNWAQVQRALALGFEKGELNNGKAARFLAARTLFHTSRYDEAEQILNSLSLDYPNDHDISNWQKVVNREASRRNLVAQHLLESAIR